VRKSKKTKKIKKGKMRNEEREEGSTSHIWLRDCGLLAAVRDDHVVDNSPAGAHLHQRPNTAEARRVDGFENSAAGAHLHQRLSTEEACRLL